MARSASILAAAAMLAVAGCGGDDSPANAGGSPTTASAPTTDPTPPDWRSALPEEFPIPDDAVHVVTGDRADAVSVAFSTFMDVGAAQAFLSRELVARGWEVQWPRASRGGQTVSISVGANQAPAPGSVVSVRVDKSS